MTVYHSRPFSTTRSWFSFKRWKVGCYGWKGMGSILKEGHEHDSISSFFQDQVQCVKRDNTKSLVGEAWVHSCIQVVDQSFMLEFGVISTQNGDRRKSTWPHQTYSLYEIYFLNYPTRNIIILLHINYIIKYKTL